jgi:hypothetical protein
MLVEMSEINALLLWRRFKPGEEMCDGIVFSEEDGMPVVTSSCAHSIEGRGSRTLAFSPSRRIPGAPEHYLVKNPFGNRNRLKRLHCRYFGRKSAYSCAC